MKNTRNNILSKNKYENRNKNSKRDNDNTSNESRFAQTRKIRWFCCGSKDNMMDTYPMKYDVTKNKWFQRNNKEIAHLQTTNDKENYGNDDASVESDADMSVTSTRSGRTAAKVYCVHYNFFTPNQKVKLVKGHMATE